MIPDNILLSGVGPYDLSPSDKRAYLIDQLNKLLVHHRLNCNGFARILDDWERHHTTDIKAIENFPYIPVTIFKEFDLKSTTDDLISVKSSATTSNRSSNIYVDKQTRKRQTLSANKILANYVGEDKRPYIIFDVEETVRGSQSLSARGAAILSLSHMASEFHFVMKSSRDSLKIDRDALKSAIIATDGKPFRAYGFTYILYLAHQEITQLGLKGLRAHPDTVFLHSGGWKKLTEIAVDKAKYNKYMSNIWGISPKNIIDFYGTVEQVGIPYPDCSEGYKHVPYWADIIIRKSDSLLPASIGETGLMQLINCLPLSSPNHSVLTEDLGMLVTEDGCACGRRGKAFIFKGRAPRSELRGCSDVARY
jgi:hypothetical protein